MLILDAVTKSLKIVLAGAVATTQLPVTAHYTDITTTAYTPGSNDTVTNSTTAVEFVVAPAASTQRHVESISVYNVDTASATVTIQYVSAGGTRQIIKVVLLTLETLIYEDGAGWQIIDANGNLKTSFPGMAPAGTAESDFIVAGTSPFAWVKKTLVEAKALLGLVITAGKTITCTQDTSLDEAVAMSSKAPKANPIFTGKIAGTLLSAITLQANDVATLYTGVQWGLLIISDDYTEAQALISFVYNKTQEISDPSNAYSITKDTGSMVNVYYESGAYKVQNKNAGVALVRITLLGN